MTKTKYYDEEDRPLLVLALDSQEFRLSHPQCETAVTRGAINYLGRWPAHISTVFIAGFLVLVTFILFGIITGILSISLGEKCRTPRNTDSNYLPNVYFVKHENRTWSQLEFCYIETTARTYDNLSIYLINLLDDDDKNGNNFSELAIELFESKNETNGYAKPFFNQDDKSALTKRKSAEIKSRKNLGAFNANIKNVDVSIRRFFNGSRLARIYNHLSKDVIEIAAKAYVLWNFPGVALDPRMYPELESFKEYLLNNRNIRDENYCAKYSTAAIELNGDIQASSVPCQAFLDYLIRQISTSKLPDEHYALKKSISDFCPKSSGCRGIRVFNRIPKTEVFKEKLNCPTIIRENEAGRNSETMQNALKEFAN